MAFLKVGSKAPDFDVPDQDGKIIQLADFKGKKVALYILSKRCNANLYNRGLQPKRQL